MITVAPARIPHYRLARMEKSLARWGLLLADIAHISVGRSRAAPQPLGHADFVISTTHPQDCARFRAAGLILCRRNMAKEIDSSFSRHPRRNP